MDGKFNVASNANLPIPLYTYYERFEQAGFPDEFLPNDRGWMPTDAFPDQVVGRTAIRDSLADRVETLIGRERAYSRAQKCNLIRDGNVLDRCDWPVNSIPTIDQSSLQMIAREVVDSRPRRNRPLTTDCSSGSNIVSRDFTIS